MFFILSTCLQACFSFVLLIPPHFMRHPILYSSHLFAGLFSFVLLIPPHFMRHPVLYSFHLFAGLFSVFTANLPQKLSPKKLCVNLLHTFFSYA
jgi:hypothetical protein